MKKFYTTLLLALVAIAASAQEQNDTTYVMFDFNLNPWNYPIRHIKTGWQPDCKDWDSPGAIITEKDFAWTVKEESSEKVILTVCPNTDWDEAEKMPVYARTENGDSSLEEAGDSLTILYMVDGATLKFKAPQGYKFGKLVFYTYRMNSFMTGDEYDEEHSYVYNNQRFTHKLKYWVPSSPKKNQYGTNIWEGDEKNIHFNNPSFSSYFEKIDIRLVSDGSAGINDLQATKKESNTMTTLDGRTVNKSEGLRKGVYIVDGKKVLVK